MSALRVGCERSERRPPAFARRDDTRSLVHRAAAGEERAWSLLVGRFEATIRSVTHRFGLREADRDEVAQRTWLALFRHIDGLGSHPALGGWIALTARNECLRLLERARREVPSDEIELGATEDAVDERLHAAERREALRRALASVPAHEQRLMGMLLGEREPSYDEISASLGIPKGSIGPTRGRCLARLRCDARLAGVVHGRPQPGHDLS